MNREGGQRGSFRERGADESNYVERVRPGLGTLVRIGVGGIAQAPAEAAIERGFEVIEAAHQALSFHEPTSALSCLNRLAAGAQVVSHPWLHRVLSVAQEISAATDGAFDVTVAPELIANGRLPVAARLSAPGVDWRDLLLGDKGVVSWRRAGLADLGGIAKGFAVDMSAEAMALPPEARWRIEAGGDLRVGGPASEWVWLGANVDAPDARAAIELHDGSLASSAVDAVRSAHFCGRTRAAARVAQFVTVVAPTCMIADALTKVVLAMGDEAARVLQRYAATAHVYSSRTGWRALGVAALASNDSDGRL